MNPPTKDELDRIIATLRKSLETWKGQEGYRRTLEVELFCVMAYRDKFVAPDTPAPSGCGENGCSFPKCDCE